MTPHEDNLEAIVEKAAREFEEARETFESIQNSEEPKDLEGRVKHRTKLAMASARVGVAQNRLQEAINSVTDFLMV